MNIEFAAKGIAPSDALKERIEGKLGKIEQRLGHSLFVRVKLTDAANGHYTCGVHFNGAGQEFTAQSTADDLFKAADEVLAKIERQVRKAQHKGEAQRTETIRGEIA
ncbi:MAG: ribosome-associated translation inhibitor RaiA [bacterium]